MMHDACACVSHEPHRYQGRTTARHAGQEGSAPVVVMVRGSSLGLCVCVCVCVCVLWFVVCLVGLSRDCGLCA